MNQTLIWQMILQIFLIGLNAVFACAEIAVISMNDNRIAQLTAQGDKRAIRLTKLTSQPAKFLATIQVAITLSGFLGSAFAADNFSEMLVQGMLKLGVGISPKTLDTIAVICITLILSYFTLVFGELVPKRVAMRKAEPLALFMSALITTIAKLFAPLVWFLTASTNGMLRLLRIDPNAADEEVSEEEIRMMVDVGSEKGVIDPEEKEMIQNVFEFDDLVVGEFATHRIDISLLWMDETIEEWEKTMHESRHSMYPLCEETVDNVIGILNIKDYYRLEDKTKDHILKSAVSPAFFIPEGIRADVLFKRMKETRNHFAVALDEYGGMVGIVTMKDLLEQLVGDLENDSSAPEEQPDIERLDSGSFRIQGRASLDDVEKMLNVSMAAEECDTFGGLIFRAYGSIPEDGSTFEVDVDLLHIKVIEVRNHRIEKAIVCVG